MFDKIVADESFRQALGTDIKAGRLSHALILEGGEEADRFLAALETACAFMCHSKEQPCMECPDCSKAMKQIHPDLHIIEKQADSSFIRVDAIRELKGSALLFPNEARRSVFIIREAQNMNVQAQNALLKVFEEPAPHLAIILTCDSRSAFLDTITSRATCYRLGEGACTPGNDACDEKAVALASELIESLAGENEFMFLKRTAAFKKDKALFKRTLFFMLNILRDAIVYQNGSRELLSPSQESAVKLAEALTRKKTLEIFDALTALYDSLALSPNHNLTVTRLSSTVFAIKTR